MVKGQNLERRNRERQRDRSNLGEALAPPTPWGSWTRGGTLLPSREEVKEEEEEGGLSPPLFLWRRNTAGAIIITAIFTNNFTAIITNSSPSMQQCNLSLTETSILHHAFISIFIALWTVISLYVTILMDILPYFTRFT